MKLKLYLILPLLFVATRLFSQATAPTGVTTNSAIANSTTVSLSGTVSGTGGDPITDKGFVYALTANPTTITNVGKVSKGAGTGTSFTTSLSGLAFGTTYHVRVYATNSIGTTYGNDLSVLTRPVAPATPTVSELTTTSFTITWPATSGTTSYRYDVATDVAFLNILPAYNNATATLAARSAALTGLTPNTTYYFRVKAVNASGQGLTSIVGQATTGPSILVTSSVSAFSACISNASDEQSFTVSGNMLTANIDITPPAGFELSKTSGGPYSSSVISLAPASGKVSTTTIYVRMASAASSPSPGNITAVSAGAATQTVSLSGTVVTFPDITLGTIDPVYSTGTSFNIPYSATTAVSYSISTTGTAMPGFTAVTDQPISGSPIAVTIPASAVGTYNFTLTVKNATGCTADYPFSLSVVTPTISANAALTPITTTYGTVSTLQSFTVSGNNLTEGVLVTPPAGFEVSIDGSIFSNTVTVGSSGTFNVPVYIRLSATAPVNNYSGNVVLSSTGAASVSTVAVSGDVNPAPITITANNVNKPYGSALTSGPGSSAFSITSGALANGNTIGSVTITYGEGAAANSPVATYTGVVTPSLPVGDNGFLISNYAVTYAPGDIVVDKATPVITFGALANATYGQADIPLTASSTNTDAAITYSSDDPTVATITPDNKIHIVGVSASPIHITASQDADANYNAALSISQPFTVNPAPVTISLSDLNTTYDGTAKSVTVTTDPMDITGLSITYNGSATAPIAAGTYAVVASLNSPNYTATNATGNLEIAKAALTVTAMGPAKPVGMALFVSTTSDPGLFTVDGTQNGETVTGVTLTPDAAGLSAATPAGSSYIVTPSLATGAGFLESNYDVNYIPFNGIVGLFTQNITFGPLATVTYGDAPFTLSATASSNLTVSYSSSNTAVATVSGNTITITGAGTTTITASQEGNSSYTSAAPIQQDITVSPKALTITATGTSKTYGIALTEVTGAYFTASATAPGEAVTNVKLTPDAAGTSANAPAGTAYIITPSQAIGSGGFLAANYDITYTPFNGTVSQAVLIVNATGVDKVYNNSTNATVTLSDNRLNGDVFNTAYIAAFNDKNIGPNKTVNISSIAISGGAADNYTVNTTATTTANITAAPVTVTAQTNTKGYDKTTASAIAPVVSGIVNGDAVSTAPTQTFNDANAGTGKTLAASGLVINDGNSGNNYTIAYINNTTGVITAATAMVTAQADTKVYDKTITSAIAPVVTGLAGSDVIGTAATQAFDNSNAGTGKMIVASGLVVNDGNNGNNYAINYVNATGAITPIPVTVTAQTDSRAYNGTTSSVKIPVVGTLITGDVVATPPTQTYDTKDAGTGKTLTASGLIINDGNNGNNYSISYVPNTTGAITTAALTYTATPVSKVYGAANPSLTGTITGFAGTDTQASATTGTLSFTSTATAASGAGSYAVAGSGLSAVNYVFAQAAANTTALTVTKANLVITANNQTRNYGQPNPALTVSYNGFVGTDNAASLTTPPTVTTTATIASLQGNYPITATGAAAANYSISYMPGTLTVLLLTNANLANLTISNGILSPSFAGTTTAYTATVNNDISSVSVVPTTADVLATVTVNGTAVSSGSGSNVTLNPGNNTITIIVTAQDGVTKQTFTITVYRALDPDAVFATNILSPNGDGKNDSWVIKDILLYPNNKVTVYDKAGRVVYAKTGYTNDWQGTYQGSTLHEDTYYYVINLGPGLRQFTGFITIVRSRSN